MKIGITINNEFDDFLSQIANVNHISRSGVCRIIVENFLSYRLSKGQIPVFRKSYSVEFSSDIPVSDFNPEIAEVLKTPWLDED